MVASANAHESTSGGSARDEVEDAADEASAAAAASVAVGCGSAAAFVATMLLRNLRLAM